MIAIVEVALTAAPFLSDGSQDGIVSVPKVLTEECNVVRNSDDPRGPPRGARGAGCRNPGASHLAPHSRSRREGQAVLLERCFILVIALRHITPQGRVFRVRGHRLPTVELQHVFCTSRRRVGCHLQVLRPSFHDLCSDPPLKWERGASRSVAFFLILPCLHGSKKV